MEQRACYRVARHLVLEQFQLSLELPDGTTCPARMDDVSARGLMAKTSHAIDPPLEPGSRLTLRLTCPARGISMRLSAIVRGVQQHSDRSWYGLAFSQPDGLTRELPADLFSLFNRRRSPRLRVGKAQRPLSVATSTGRRTLGTLGDISSSGASISVPAGDDPGFRLGERICVSGRLAEGADCMCLVGTVRRIRKLPDDCLYGIEFAWEATGSCDQRALLERFIAHLHQAAPHSPRARRIAERRVAQRARPSGNVPIQVELQGEGDRSARAQLRDLSATGIGVVLSALEDPEFGDDETMQIRVRLPAGELDFVARVRRGLLVDGHVCYGLEFDTERTADFSASQEVIRSFVADHFGAQEEPPMITVGS